MHCKKEAISLCLCLFRPWMNLNSEMTSQRKLDLFSSIVVHESKSAQLPHFEKVQDPKKKFRAKNKRFRQSNQGSSQSLFMPETFWWLVAR